MSWTWPYCNCKREKQIEINGYIAIIQFQILFIWQRRPIFKHHRCIMAITIHRNDSSLFMAHNLIPSKRFSMKIRNTSTLFSLKSFTTVNIISIWSSDTDGALIGVLLHYIMFEGWKSSRNTVHYFSYAVSGWKLA